MAKKYTMTWLKTTKRFEGWSTVDHVPVIGAVIKRPNALDRSQWFLEFCSRSTGFTIAALTVEEAANDSLVMSKVEAWLAEKAA